VTLSHIGWRFPARRLLIASVLVLTLTIAMGRLAYIVQVYSSEVFAWDQWDFLTPLFEPRGITEILTWQHGPHRMGVGLPLMLLVERGTDWNAAAIAWLNLCILSLAAIVAVAVKYRIAGNLSISDAVIPWVCLNSSQWDILAGVPDASHGPLPLLLLLLFVLVFMTEPSWPRAATLMLLSIAAVYTGFGAILGVLAPVAILSDIRTDTNRYRPWIICAVVLSSLGSFFVGYHSKPGPCLSGRRPGDLGDLVAFPVMMFARAVGATRSSSPLVILGMIAGVCVSVVTVWSGRWLAGKARNRAMIALWVLGAFSVLFVTATTIGRYCFGSSGGLASRYVPYMVPGLLATFICGAVKWECASATARRGAIGALAIYLAADVWPRSVDYRQMAYQRDGKARWAKCIRDGGRAAACQGKGFYIHPHPKRSNLDGKIDAMRRQGVGPFRFEAAAMPR
jgi:hypothetical protein